MNHIEFTNKTIMGGVDLFPASSLAAYMSGQMLIADDGMSLS